MGSSRVLGSGFRVYEFYEIKVSGSSFMVWRFRA